MLTAILMLPHLFLASFDLPPPHTLALCVPFLFLSPLLSPHFPTLSFSHCLSHTLALSNPHTFFHTQTQTILARVKLYHKVLQACVTNAKLELTVLVTLQVSWSHLR